MHAGWRWLGIVGLSVAWATADPLTATNDELLARWRAAAPTYGVPPFLTRPLAGPTFALGELDPRYLDNGLKLTNFLRYLAGLPPVQLDSALNVTAQHGAVVLAALKRLDHHPPQPDGMPDDFYQTAKAACGTSNLGAGYATLEQSVLGYVTEGGLAGHRRWVLNPNMLATGFGLAQQGDTRYTCMAAFDRRRQPPWPFQWVAWPNGGLCPVGVVQPDTVWSLSLNPDQYAKPVRGDLRITVRRPSDGQTWEWTAESASAPTAKDFLVVDPTGYGLPNCILFNAAGLGQVAAGETREVRIAGLTTKTGEPATVEYTVRFIALEHPAVASSLTVQRSKFRDYDSLAVTLNDFWWRPRIYWRLHRGQELVRHYNDRGFWFIGPKPLAAGEYRLEVFGPEFATVWLALTIGADQSVTARPATAP